MPVNHFILPFQYQGKEAVSEFWIDPDAEKKEEEKDGGRKIRLLVDFEIRGLGDFQLLADLQDHKISMELGVPKNLSAGAGEIQAKLQEICARNGMRVKMMQVQEKLITVFWMFSQRLEKRRMVSMSAFERLLEQKAVALQYSPKDTAPVIVASEWDMAERSRKQPESQVPVL